APDRTPFRGAKRASRENALGSAADARVLARSPPRSRAGPCHWAKSGGRPFRDHPQGSCLQLLFLSKNSLIIPIKSVEGVGGVGTMQVGKLQSGDEGPWQQETRMLLQTLRTRDPDELAQGFRHWELRFRQLGGGSFRGELKFLQLGATQILR